MITLTPDQFLLLDSSVVIKWFRPEVDDAVAIALKNLFVNGQIEIRLSDLVLYEMANALLFSEDFSDQEILEALQSIVALKTEIYVFDLATLESALKIGRQSGLAIYDAYLIALAQKENLLFVTADAKLTRKLPGEKNLAVLRELNLTELE
ncbi:MAG: type II toxin-antitoxin system VapC family toxin [Chloroflexi bacterium]|nr:type II toxin-antitoxin system VapC family toxin [Chloroflexota bacterium]